MTRLSRVALRDRGVELALDPARVTPGVVHLGIGAFHRAHQAAYTQAAMLETGDLSWGITGTTLRSSTVVDQLAPQDGLYTLTERGDGARPTTVVSAVTEVVPGHLDGGTVVARIAAASTRVVTLTVTEKGYHLDPATGGLAHDVDVRTDLSGRVPVTPVGQLVAGLSRRRSSGARPLTVVSCDNLPANGAVLARLVQEYADALAEPGLREWVERHVRFPSSMVDRITPATTDTDRALVADTLGLEDHGAVIAEPFTQWVLEDDIAGDIPAWDRVGVQLASDVAPFEQLKLRVLNGSHTLLALLGSLDGIDTIAGAVADPAMRAAAEAMIRHDVAPTLPANPGLDPLAYGGITLERFANPALRHTTSQVASETSQKLGPRILGTVRDQVARGVVPTWSALAVAAWIRRVVTTPAEQLDDPVATRLRNAVAGLGEPSDLVLALGADDLPLAGVARHDGFRTAIAAWYDRLAAGRATDAIEEALRHA